jgi:hypothetical protein
MFDGTPLMNQETPLMSNLSNHEGCPDASSHHSTTVLERLQSTIQSRLVSPHLGDCRFVEGES